MKRLVFMLPLVLILLAFTACDRNHSTNPSDTGKLPIAMNLSPALQHGFNITQVHVIITKGDYSAEMDMAIDSTYASCSFDNLEMGVYAIDVAVYENALLIATGQGTGTVSPGQTTTVYITLQFVPGGLEVIVGWGLPYEDCRRVLFVGNSHTYYNGGVNTHVHNLLQAVHPEWETDIQAQTYGGYSLQDHFNTPATISAIENGNWDLVILQDNSEWPLLHPDLFYQYSIALDNIIRQSGALTGFYMTWAWRYRPEMYLPTRNAYTYIGAYLDALVAPCGIAFHNSIEADSTIVLHDADTSHASLNGTYLVACTFLAGIWNINPIGNPYIPTGIDHTTALHLQTIAWNTVQAYNNSRQALPALEPENRPDLVPEYPELLRAM